MNNEELVRLIQGGRRELMGELYTQNRNFIQGIIRRGGLYPDTRPEDYEDAMQDAYFGLCEAAKGFDESKGYKFLTYAKRYIQNAIQRGVCNAIHIPEYVKTTVRKIKRIQNLLAQELECTPTTAELSVYTGLDAETIKSTLNIVKPVKSIYEPVQGADDLTVEDNLIDESICFEDDIAAADERRHVREVVADLPETDRKVIEMYYFDGMSLSEIGSAEGVGTETIRQRKSKALRRLRYPQYSRRLLDIDNWTPFYNHVGVSRFNNTWTSSTEAAVLERERIEIQSKEKKRKESY